MRLYNDDNDAEQPRPGEVPVQDRAEAEDSPDYDLYRFDDDGGSAWNA